MYDRNVTKVFEVRDGREPRLMNTISHGSRFDSMPWTKGHNISMGDAANQMRAAREIVAGWSQCNSEIGVRYVIEHNGRRTT